MNSCLAMNTFLVTWAKIHFILSFVTGQPLGYLGSWPLFALSHHLVVWAAANRVYPTRSIFSKNILEWNNYAESSEN